MKPVLGPLAIIERGPGRYSLTGEIDLATAPQLDHLEDVHGPLLLDLHGVTFMDSTGMPRSSACGSAAPVGTARCRSKRAPCRSSGC